MADSLKNITLQSLVKMLPQELIIQLAQTCITRVYTVHERMYHGPTRAGGWWIIFRGVFSSYEKANQVTGTQWDHDRIIVEHILDVQNKRDLERIYVHNPNVIPSFLLTDETKILSTSGPLTVVTIDEEYQISGL